MTLRFALDGPTRDFWLDDVYFYKVEDGKRVGKNLIYNGTFDSDVMAGSSSVDSSNASGIGRTFSIEDAQERMSMLPKIPVYRNSGITVDGDISEWENIPTIHMPIDDTQYYHLSFDPVDITADLKFAYDDENLYILLSVTDDVHYVLDNADDFWKGDCIQYTISTFDEVYGKGKTVSGCIGAALEAM